MGVSGARAESVVDGRTSKDVAPPVGVPVLHRRCQGIGTCGIRFLLRFRRQFVILPRWLHAITTGLDPFRFILLNLHERRFQTPGGNVHRRGRRRRPACHVGHVSDCALRCAPSTETGPYTQGHVGGQKRTQSIIVRVLQPCASGLCFSTRTWSGTRVSFLASNHDHTAHPVAMDLPVAGESPDAANSVATPRQLDTQSPHTSMLPPPTPGSVRASGRMIKPTLKMRGEEEGEADGAGGLEGDSAGPSSPQGTQVRTRLKPALPSDASSSRPSRVKLSLKSGHASRGKGDPTLAGTDKTRPYMQGYDRELDSSDDETGEGMAFEEQIILRMPEGHDATKRLADWVRRREMGNDGREVELKFKGAWRALACAMYV